MNNPKFSIVVPVYNRPQETADLLESLAQQDYKNFEVIVVEDGSNHKSDSAVNKYISKLDLKYFYKPNSGPGDSRNYGAAKALGDYLIFFDSDCVIPTDYLQVVDHYLSGNPLDAFGGPDRAHSDFSTLQIAINYSMTSLLTTAGVRGHRKAKTGFQPRSFNMGIATAAFKKLGGFTDLHPGEDPDLVIRLKKQGFTTGLIPAAWVIHKRRTDLKSFARQVYKFGIARSILMKWHSEGKSWKFFAPSIALCCSIIFIILGSFIPFFWLLLLFGWLVIFLDALVVTRNLAASVVAVVTTTVQILGYGWGFLKGFWLLHVENRNERKVFKRLFFN